MNANYKSYRLLCARAKTRVKKAPTFSSDKQTLILDIISEILPIFR